MTVRNQRGVAYLGSIGVVIAALMAGYVAVCFAGYLVTRQAAIANYRRSRGPNPPPMDSYEFATRGIKYGFTEEQVDERMKGATEKTGECTPTGCLDL